MLRLCSVLFKRRPKWNQPRSRDARVLSPWLEGPSRDRATAAHANVSGDPGSPHGQLVLINIQTHMAKRTGRYHKIGPLLLGFTHMHPHGHGDGFLFEDNGKPAAFGSSGVGHWFATDGL